MVPTEMKPSGACRALVRNAEGCCLQAYLCPAGIPTIGVGHTRGVKLGDRCSVQQADLWLTQDLEEAAAAVATLVKVPLTQGQFDALTSFVFNLGARRLAESTLLILLNKRDYHGAAAQFSRWVHSNGEVLDGLVRRRAAEVNLFMPAGGDVVTAPGRWVAGLFVAPALIFVSSLGVRAYGDHRYDIGHAAAIAGRAGADAAAVLKRTSENATRAAEQGASNTTITEKKHEEIQPVRERIVTRRVYVGSALCGDGPAAPAETESAPGSDSADPPGRLVRPDVERDLVALKLAVEEDLATGRACQAVLKGEGMVP